MAQRRFDKKPLYRRVNRTARGAPCGQGGEYRWQRNTKAEKSSQATHAGMGPKHQHGLDYTPLFKFLLSKVGEDWDAVHSEAVSRLDKEEPIFWLVARSPDDERPVVRVGEASYYSGLRISADNRLERVAPDLTERDLYPFCACCTHTFNGHRFTNPFSDETQTDVFETSGDTS
ncbi:MAG: hypothetical protein AAGP08_17485 [Pseudomonadota bacterium]